MLIACMHSNYNQWASVGAIPFWLHQELRVSLFTSPTVRHKLVECTESLCLSHRSVPGLSQVSFRSVSGLCQVSVSFLTYFVVLINFKRKGNKNDNSTEFESQGTRDLWTSLSLHVSSADHRPSIIINKTLQTLAACCYHLHKKHH